MEDMNNSLTYGTPARMMPDMHDRCHGDGCGKIMLQDALDYIEGQPFCLACRMCSGCGVEVATLMMNGELLCRACRDLHPSCPDCGKGDVRVEEYDFGTDRETGTRDAGERGICRACGCNADVADFAPRKILNGDQHSEGSPQDSSDTAKQGTLGEAGRKVTLPGGAGSNGVASIKGAGAEGRGKTSIEALACTACESGDHGSIGADLAHREMRCDCACRGGK